MVLAGIATGTILTTLSLTMVVAAAMAAAGAASLGWGEGPCLLSQTVQSSLSMCSRAF